MVFASSAGGQVSLRVNRILQVGAIGSHTQNCQALRDTLTSITDSSASIRYLVRLEPGTYDCGSTTVFVPSGVTLEGSGREMTTIVGDTDHILLGVIHLVDYTALRALTVNNQKSSPDFDAIAVSVWKVGGNVSKVRFDRVHLQANLAGGVGAGSALMGISATITVYSSDFLSQTDVEGGDLSLRFSTVEGTFPGSGPKLCHFCTKFSGIVLNSNCL